MEMQEAGQTGHSGQYTRRSSLDQTVLPVTGTNSADVVIANQATDAIVTKRANMEPSSAEEPFISNDGLNASDHPRESGKPNYGILKLFIRLMILF